MYLQQSVQNQQLALEIRNKNRRIDFLQDKIILIQKEKQSKLLHIQSKYAAKISKLIQQNQYLYTQNCQLKKRNKKYKQKAQAIEQDQKRFIQRINTIEQRQQILKQQQQNYKQKYQKQKSYNKNLTKHNSQLATQITQLKQLIFFMQNQKDQIKESLHKLNLQKSVILQTYQDYDEVKIKLKGIQQVYSSQYENQVNIVREKMRCQMEQNTKRILSQIENQSNNQRYIQLNDKTITKYPCHHNLQQSNNNLKQSNSKLEQSSDKLEQLGHKLEQYSNKLCRSQQFKDQNKWQQDMITLKNFIDYGKSFIQLYKNKSQITYHNLQSLIKQFNYKQSQSVYYFLQQLISQISKLKEQNQQKVTIINEIKHQMTEKIQLIMNELQDHKKQQKLFNHQASQTQHNQFQKDYIKINQLYDTNLMLKKKLTQTKFIIKTLVEIIIKFQKKYQAIQFSTNIFLNLKSKNIKQQRKSIKQQRKPINQQRISIKQQRKPIIKLKYVMIGVFFIQHLKKKSLKLKKNVNRILGINNLSNSNSIVNTVLFENQVLTKYFDDGSYFSKILMKILFQIKKQKLLSQQKCHINSINLKNLQIQNWFNEENLPQQNIYQLIMKIIFQQRVFSYDKH